MTASYNDPVPDGDYSRRHRYRYDRGYCTWCGLLKWLTEEKLCGSCYEDPTRIDVEYANAREARRNKK